MADPDGTRAGTGASGALLRYAPSRFVEPLLALLSLPILSRVLGAEGYGQLSVLILTAGLIRNVAFDWVGNCALRFRKTHADDLDLFFPNLVAGLLGSAALSALVLIPLRIWFNNGALLVVGAYLWWLFADALFSGVAFSGEMVLRATHRPVAFTLSRVFQAASRHVLAVAGLLLLSRDMAAYFGARVLGLVLISWWSWSTIGSWGHLRWRRVSWRTQREFLWFGFPLAVMLLANGLRVVANRYVVLWLDGPEATGLYSAAVNIGSAPLLVFQQVVMLGLYPLAIDAWERGESILPVMRDGLRYFFLAGIPALVGLGLLARPILGVVAGRQYAAAWPVLVLLAAAMFLYGLSQYFSLHFMVAKRTGVMATIGLITGAVNVGLSVFLVGRFGYQAAAVATLTANFLLLAGMIWWGMRPWIGALPGVAAGRSLLAAGAMTVVVVLLRRVVSPDHLPGLILSIAAGSFVYGGVLWSTGELKTELEQVRAKWRSRG